MFTQREIDQMSDGLKRAALAPKNLFETKVSAWFVNTPHGPEFFTGAIRGAEITAAIQPLYGTPVNPHDEPVAWLTRASGILITQDRSNYRDDLEWEPLYLARL